MFGLSVVAVGCGEEEAPNKAPQAVVIVQAEATVGETVQLNGVRSSDPEEAALTFAWSLKMKPDASTAEITPATGPRPRLTIDVPGKYIVELTVNDGTQDSLPNTATIQTTNRAPVANAGVGLSVDVGDTVTLDGSGSSDPDGDAITHEWSIVGRPMGSTVELSDSTAINPSFVTDGTGFFDIQLVVKDATERSLPATVRVRSGVLNTPPTAACGSNQRTTIGTAVTLSSAGSSDPDGDPLMYSWSIATRPAGSVAALGAPAMASATLAPDVAGTYGITLGVSDGIDTAMCNVEVSATEVAVASTELAVLTSAIQMTDIHGAGPDAVYAVGRSGTIRRWQGGEWRHEWSGTDDDLSAVHARTADDVWAAGSSGTILRRVGGEWTTMTLPSNTSQLTALWATSANDAWAVGSSATCLRWDGTAWRTVPIGVTGGLRDVWAADANNAWAVGSGSIMHFDGTSWIVQWTGTADLRSVWGTSATDVWVAGAWDGLMHWDGSQWRSVPDTRTLIDVFGTGPNDVWTVGERQVMHYDGTAWSPALTGGYFQAVAGWAESASSVWVLTQDGGVARYDGVRWSYPPHRRLPGDVVGLSVYGARDARLAVRGSSGTGGGVARWDGARWSVEYDVSGFRVADMWSPSPDEVWLIDADGEVARYDGAAWSPVASPGSQLQGVYGRSSSDVWIWGGASFDRELYHWDGSTWTSTPAVSNDRINAMGGTAANDLWAVHHTGRIAHYDGVAWGEVASPTTRVLNDVIAFSPTDAWAVGGHPNNFTEGGVYRWDGQAWSLVYTAGDELEEVWGTSSNNLWAVAERRQVLHYDGTTWQAIEVGHSGFEPHLDGAADAVWLAADDRVFERTSSGWARWGVTATYEEADDVWGTSPTDLWIAGGDAITHFDGNVMRSYPITGYRDSRVLWGGSASDIWMGGEEGMLWHYDGVSWTEQPSPTTADIEDIGGVNPNALFAAAGYQQTLRYDGTRWASIQVGVRVDIDDLWVTSDSMFYAGGSDGFGLVIGQQYQSLFDDETIYDIVQADSTVYASGGGELFQYRGAVTEVLDLSGLWMNALSPIAGGSVVGVGRLNGAGAIVFPEGTRWLTKSGGPELENIRTIPAGTFVTGDSMTIMLAR